MLPHALTTQEHLDSMRGEGGDRVAAKVDRDGSGGLWGQGGAALSGLYLRMKSWSCCGIQTLDFGAFLAQPGCKVGRHDWARQVSPTVPELVMRSHFQTSFLLPVPRGQALSIPLVCCPNEIPLLIP